MTTLARPKRVAHSDQRVPFGGGVFSDTRAGTRDAARKGYRWIDKNGHLMPLTVADKAKAPEAKNLVWINAHGAPHNLPWVEPGKKYEDYAFVPKKAQHPTLQSAEECFLTCRRYKMKIEWEPKDLHPLASVSILRKMFRELAAIAQRVFGATWRRWVIVKCLTNLRGGITYCKRVLRAAHEAGFDTMVLARGDWVHKVINESYITWNRGGIVA